MNIIDETEKLKLEFDQELVLLTEKSSSKILLKEAFYGNPNCGIIDTENKWTIVGGVHLTLWKPSETIKYRSEIFEYIHSIRIKNNKIVEILTDPWTDKSSIWELNIENSELKKIKDFVKYRNRKYTEFVEW